MRAYLYRFMLIACTACSETPEDSSKDGAVRDSNALDAAVSDASHAESSPEPSHSATAEDALRDSGAFQTDASTEIDGGKIDGGAAGQVVDSGINELPDTEIDARAPPYDGGTVDASGPHLIDASPAFVPDLCGNEDGTVFYAVRRGGNFPVGAELFGQNGNYMVLEGSCQAFCQDFLGRAFGRQFDEQSEHEFASELHVEKIEALSGTHTRSLCDGPTESISFGEYAVHVISACPVGEDNPEVEVLLGDITRATSTCGSEGWSALQGGVRFNLVRVEEGTYPDAELTWFRAAPPWPLSGDPDEIAKDVDDPTLSDPTEALPLEGDDAAALRALRDAFLAGEIGSPGDWFVPIQQPDGRMFLLYVRDTTPLEDELGRVSFQL